MQCTLSRNSKMTICCLHFATSRSMVFLLAAIVELDSYKCPIILIVACILSFLMGHKSNFPTCSAPLSPPVSPTSATIPPAQPCTFPEDHHP